MIDTKAITLCITVREEPALQHFIGRKTNAGNDIGWIEGDVSNSLGIAE